MLRFNDIADRMLEYNPGCNLPFLQSAYVFTAKVHEGQERLSGEPYLVHPLEVAGILVDMRVDDVTVVAGLLHDTVEDTVATPDEIERAFGEEVGFIVEGLTKIAKIEFTSVKERQAENFRKMLIAMSKDIRILLIKLADRLHNMRTVQFMSEDARRRIAEETLEIYVPLAHRLGMNSMKQELQDLAFRTLKPRVAEELEHALRGIREERESYIEEVIAAIDARLDEAGLEGEVTGRVKDLASINAKMERESLSFDQVHDKIAFRIVLQGGTEACYAALGSLHGIWRPVPGRFKDYIALPKQNGYKSLHTTLIGPYGERMEVQIRTEQMHREAEFGISAHWKYKEGRFDTGGEGDDDERRFGWLRELLEWQRELADPHEFIDAVKVDLFPEEVFVFTPRGEVINLPRRSTPVDFAYAIHSEVGAHCAGARVNGKMVPLRQPLDDGDTVEIITNANQFPRKDWLEFVASGRARQKIRHAIRDTERARSRQIGRDILEKELRRGGFSLAKMSKNGELEAIAQREVKGSPEELFGAVGYGRVSASSLVRKLRGEPAEEPGPDAEKETRSLRSLFRRSKPRSSGSGIRVSGQPDVMVRFGGCCTPLPGDEIIGFVTRGRGVTVHARECPRIFDLAPERRIEVDWDTEAAVARRVRIRVTSRDEPGLLAKVTKTISSAGVNISGATITTREDRLAEQVFDLWVGEVSTLSALMKEIERIKGVHSVERVRT